MKAYRSSLSSSPSIHMPGINGNPLAILAIQMGVPMHDTDGSAENTPLYLDERFEYSEWGLNLNHLRVRGSEGVFGLHLITIILIRVFLRILKISEGQFEFFHREGLTRGFTSLQIMFHEECMDSQVFKSCFMKNAWIHKSSNHVS